MTAIISEQYLLSSRMHYMFRHFRKAIIKHRHKNVTEKKHNSNLNLDFVIVHPVMFRVQQLEVIILPSIKLNMYTKLCRR